jgi:hypothetical protein
MNAILTGMEMALLRSMGLSQPSVEPVKGAARLEYRAVIVRPSGRTIEALGNSSEDATRKVIRLAVSR